MPLKQISQDFIDSPGDRAVERRGFKWVLVLLWLAIAGVVLWAAALFLVPRYLRYAAIEELNQLGYVAITDEGVRFQAKPLDQKSLGRLCVLLRRVQWTSLELGIPEGELGDLSPLAGPSGLTVLDLSNSPVSDLSPLTGLSGLTKLYLLDTQVSDLSPIAGLSGLRKILLSKDREVKIPESLEKVIVRL